jgi:hypothetical protein
MYFEKQIMKKQNGQWNDLTNYKALNEQALNGNIPLLVKGDNWNISKNKITISGGL